MSSGIHLYSKYASLDSIKTLAESLISNNNRDTSYFIGIYELHTRLPISYYFPRIIEGTDAIEWTLLEEEDSISTGILDNALEELGIEMDYESEIIKTRAGQMAGTRIHKKRPKDNLNAISDEDIARLKAKFLK